MQPPQGLDGCAAIARLLRDLGQQDRKPGVGDLLTGRLRQVSPLSRVDLPPLKDVSGNLPSTESWHTEILDGLHPFFDAQIDPVTRRLGTIRGIHHEWHFLARLGERRGGQNKT